MTPRPHHRSRRRGSRAARSLRCAGGVPFVDVAFDEYVMTVTAGRTDAGQAVS
jgi:hypothetical protein